MSIQEISVGDKTRYRVVVVKRSRKDRTLRVLRQRLNIESLSEAQKLERKLIREASDKLAELEYRGSTLERLISRWFQFNLNQRVQLGEITEKTLRDDRAALNKWLSQYMHKPAVELSPFALSNVFRNMRELGVSHRQQLRLKRMVKSLFEFGKHYGYLPSEIPIPTSEVALKSDGEKVPEILTLPEIQKLLACAIEEKHPWRHIWSVALLTGMRSGELKALSWNDVDFENQILRVSKSIQAETGIEKSTKAGYWRDIPINEQLKRTLDELRPTTGSTGYVLPRLWEWEKGEQARVLRSFCVAHKITPVKFHTLRACFATQLLRQGVEPAKVMKVAGWKDLSTMQRYIRLAGIEIRGVTQNLDLLPPVDYTKKVVSLHGI